jgi:hypothetical protein
MGDQSDKDVEFESAASESGAIQTRKSKKFKTDGEGFKSPIAPRTRKQTNSQKFNAVQTSNGFGILTDNESDTGSESTTSEIPRKRKTPTTKILDIQSTSSKTQKGQSTATNAQKSTKSDGEKRSKPIRVPNSTFPVIKTLLASMTLSKRPEVKKSYGNSFIIVSNSADKKKILTKLNEQSIESFTYSEPEERHNIFIIQGHHHVPAEELLEKLKMEEIPAEKVYQLGRSVENPTYSVSFAKSSITLRELQNQHSTIDGLGIKWKKYETKKVFYTQCKRCQRWGHGGVNCNLKRRCVKCLLDHPVGECARKSRDEGEPSCVNCQKTGHPANSTTQCEVAKKHIESIEKQKQKQTTNRPREFHSTPAPWARQQYSNNNFPLLPSKVINPATNQSPQIVHDTNREYRPVLTQPRDKNNLPQKENIGSFADMQEEIMGIPGMVETMKRYRELIRQLKSNSDTQAQLKVLISFGLTGCV